MQQNLAKQNWCEIFFDMAERLFSELAHHESLELGIGCDQSLFTRINSGQVRQITELENVNLSMDLFSHQSKTTKCAFTLNGRAGSDTNFQLAKTWLQKMRSEIDTLPDDPFISLPENHGELGFVKVQPQLDHDQIVLDVLESVNKRRFMGLVASGPLLTGQANSRGQRRWFETENFFVDYSAMTPDQKPIKALFSGKKWDRSEFAAHVDRSWSELRLLEQARREIPRGRYRVYLGPRAVSDMVGMLSWDGVGEASLQRGQSVLVALREKRKSLSPLFTLRENFNLGFAPRFNRHGEIAPAEVSVIEKGELKSSLVSSRSAKEFGVKSNGAESWEYLRSPELLPGTLKREDILKQLDTGLWLSDVHYLNWSDRASGRMTGVTRYACFWVENGKIVAPIVNMRFDESIYQLWGSGLVALTDFQDTFLDTSTYMGRQMSGYRSPGMLVDDFTFTL